MLTHPLSHIFPPFLNEFYPLSKFQLCNTVLSTLVPRLYVRPSELLQLFFFFFFFGHARHFFFQHVDVLEPGIEREPQQWQCQILNLLSHQGTPRTYSWKSVHFTNLSPFPPTLQHLATTFLLSYFCDFNFFFPIPHKNESIPYFSLSRWYLTRTQSSPASSTLL